MGNEENNIEIESMTDVPDTHSVFHYTAMCADGKEESGEIVSESSSTVNTYLKQHELFPLAINKVKEVKRLPNEQVGNDELEMNEETPKTRVIFSFTIFGFRFTLERVIK